MTFTESANDQHPDYNLTQVLYAFDKDKAADLLTAIGLGDGAGRYENADVLNYETSAPLAPVDAEAGVDAQAIAQVRNCWYYQSDVLNKALADAGSYLQAHGRWCRSPESDQLAHRRREH